jgi:isopenicillin N synthase-like dioxygenase
LAHLLLSLIARGLGLKEDYFKERFTDDPTILFRIFSYPKHEWNEEQDEWGVREHTDYGFLTILK